MRYLAKCLIVCMTFPLLIVTAPAYATELRITNAGGGFACFTEHAHDEFMEAVTAKDTSWMMSLVKSGECFQMKVGLKATLKDYSMWGTSEIYLHPPGEGRPIAVWTVNENFDMR